MHETEKKFTYVSLKQISISDFVEIKEIEIMPLNMTKDFEKINGLLFILYNGDNL